MNVDLPPKTRPQGVFGFALLVAAALGLAFFAAGQVVSLNDALELLAKDRMAKADRLVELRDNVHRVARSVRSLVLAQDEKAIAAEARRVEAVRARNGEVLKQLLQLPYSARSQQMLGALLQHGEPYQASVARVLALAAQGRREEASTMLYGEMDERQQAFQTALGELLALQRELMKQAAADAENQLESARLLMLVAAALSAGLGIGFGAVVTRRVTRPRASAA